MIGAGLLFGFRLTAVKKKKREYAMRRWKEMEGDGIGGMGRGVDKFLEEIARFRIWDCK